MSTRHVRAALAGALLLVGAGARAQLPDLVEMSSQYMAGVLADAREGIRAQVTSYDGALNVPLPLGAGLFLIPGLAYHVESVSYPHVPQRGTALRGFHAVDVPLLLVKLLPGDWALSFRLAPGVAGDFQALDRDMLRLSAMVLATRSFSERLVLGGGGLASYGFGAFLPLPAVYLDWRPTPRWQLEAFLPAFVTLKSLLHDRLEVGVRAEVSGNSYAIRTGDIAGQWPCTPGPGPASGDPGRTADASACLDHVAYSTATAGGLIGVRLFQAVWLTGYAGHSLYRRFESLNARNAPAGDGGDDLPNVFFFRLGLAWRLPRA